MIMKIKKINQILEINNNNLKIKSIKTLEFHLYTPKINYKSFHFLLKTNNKDPFSKTISYLNILNQKNLFKIRRNLLCIKDSEKDEVYKINPLDDRRSTRIMIEKELAKLFYNLKLDFYNIDKLKKFIEFCSNVNQNKFLTEKIYLDYIEEILNKIYDQYKPENLEIILEILTKNLNNENEISYKKWEELLIFLSNNKIKIEFNTLINVILTKISSMNVLLDYSSNNLEMKNQPKKNLKNYITKKIFDIFILEDIFDIQKFASCNYSESKLLIKLFTPYFIERSKINFFKLIKNYIGENL